MNALGSTKPWYAWRWLLPLFLVLVCGEPRTATAQDMRDGWWSAGAEVVVAQPRFSDNLALSRSDEDQSGNVRGQSLAFDYDFASSPRVWLQYSSASDIGVRASWWQVDAAANGVRANPPASGFGKLDHPSFPDINLSSVVPGESLAADSAFNLDTIDLEITKHAALAHWDLLFSAGLRHARIDQQYDFSLSNTGGVTAGRIALDRSLSGLGPTVGIASSRVAFDRLLLDTGVMP